MSEIRKDIVQTLTRSKSRKSLYHFTRARNLEAIAHFDALWSSTKMKPDETGVRRTSAQEVYFSGFSLTINAHLKIPDTVIHPAITQEQFRLYLNRHVFFWPTLKDCQKMMETYARREPEEAFAVLELDAYVFLIAHFDSVKLSKYDSGSAPRYPLRSSYKKSMDMFLPLHRFQIQRSPLVPTKPSEVKEVLIEEQVEHVSDQLKAVYVNIPAELPNNWKGIGREMNEIMQ